MVDLSIITKNPPNMLMAAGAAVIVYTLVSKKGSLAGIKKKHVQYAGGAAIVGGLAMKYMKKTPAPVVTPPPVVQTLGNIPQPTFTASPYTGAVSPAPMGGIAAPGNFANVNPTIGGTGTMPVVLGGRARSMVASTARKANLANQNTLGAFYGTLSR